jgi:hypothetical protein
MANLFLDLGSLYKKKLFNLSFCRLFNHRTFYLFNLPACLLFYHPAISDYIVAAKITKSDDVSYSYVSK